MSDEQWSDEREIRISAPPEDVWAAWAEPAHVRNWFSDDARGDLEPGGELVHEFHGHGEHRYRVVEVEAPSRLVLDGEMDGRAFRQIVEIRNEAGTTVLRLVHSGFGPADPDSEIVQGIDSGWSMALALLKYYVEHHFGKQKATHVVFRPARFEYEPLLQRRYLTGAGLDTWLTRGARGIDLEGPVTLDIQGVGPHSGRALAVTDHEVSVTLDEIDGVLELKAFGAGPEARVLGVRLVSWAREPELIDPLRGALDDAVARLVDAVHTEVPASG